MSTPSPTPRRRKLALLLVCTALAFAAPWLLEDSKSGQTSLASVHHNGDAPPSELAPAPGSNPASSAPQPSPPGSRPNTATAQTEALRLWMRRHTDAAPDARPQLLDEGVALARSRKDTLRQLIQKEPEQAILNALRFDEVESLPLPVRRLVETPFSQVADYNVFPVCPGAGPADHERDTPAIQTAELRLSDGSLLKAFTYGRRQAVASKQGLPVQGIALDELAAIRDGVFQPVSGAEARAARSAFPPGQPDASRSFASGQPITGEPVQAVAGGRVYSFATQDELKHLDSALAKLDSQPGPKSGSRVLYSMPYSADAAAGAGFDLQAATSMAVAASGDWTLTKKRVFLIRVDFPDIPAKQPTGRAEALAVLNGTASTAIQRMSYGKTSLEGDLSVAVYRMPKPSTYYADLANYDPNSTGFSSKNSELLDDAKAAFAAGKSSTLDASIDLTVADTDPSHFHVVGVSFPDIDCRGAGFHYAGLASVGGGDMWMQGSNEAKVYVHEMGHVYSLAHSNFWQTTDSSVVGNGTEKEYGDIFDVMGAGDLPAGHFHPQAKQKLSWLDATQWTDATAAGSKLHRIYRHDDADTSGLVRGVRVTKSAAGGGEYYWIGYRAAYPENAHLSRGAYMLWQRPNTDRCCLIDTTPQSAEGKVDAALDIGRTYADKTAGVYITPIAKGGEGHEQYLDVQINVGPFPNNTAPVLTALSGASQVAARTTTSFNATASDAESDLLAYAWNAGDGTITGGTGAAAASFSHAWITAGTYNLSVTISDMKGGSVTRTQQVIVDDPAQRFEPTTLAGANGTIYAITASDTLLVAVGKAGSGTDTNVIRTSTDGANWITRTVAEWTGNLTLRSVVWTGSNFVAVGEDNDGKQQGWFGVIYASPNGLTWTRVYTASQPGTTLYSVASGAGVCLAGGDGGTLLLSSDGTNWERLAAVPGLDSNHTVEGLAFGNASFVLTSHKRVSGSTDNGSPHVCTSPDGRQWTDRVAGAGVEDWQDLRRIAYLNDRFVSSGWYSKLRVSTDTGATFTSTRNTPEEAYFLTYGAGLYFASGIERPAAGTNGSDKPVRLYSMDGVSWAQVSVPVSMGTQNAGAMFNSRLISSGTDGRLWRSNVIGNGPANNAPVINSLGVQSILNARSPVTFAVSASDKDGDTLRYFWDAGTDSTANTGPVFTHQWPSSGTYQVSVTVSDGRGGSVTQTKSVQVLDSGLSFNDRTSGTNADLNTIATNGAVLVAGGTTAIEEDSGSTGFYHMVSPPIRTSSDGAIWTPRSVSDSLNLTIYSMVWDGSKFVAVGLDSSETGWMAVVYTSSDGKNWTSRYSSTPQQSGDTRLLAVAANGNNVLLAGGDAGLLLRSTDGGMNWSRVTLSDVPNTHAVEGIAYGAGTFVLTAHRYSVEGANGDARVLTSTDGQTWTARTASLQFADWMDLRGISHLNDRFVTSGYSKLMVSTDGGASFSSSRTNYEQMPALAYGNGVYFAGGVRLPTDAAQTTTNLHLISTDGVQWTNSSIPSGVFKENAATFFQNTFVVVGNNGRIWQSGASAASTPGLEIILPPVNTAAVLGGSATFSVTASGQGALSYQWKKGATPLANATSNSLTLSNLSALDSGSYSVDVTDAASNKTLTSASAVLTVNTPVSITAQPPSQTVTAGSAATLSVTATGSAPLSYQWRKEGVTLTNATSSTLSLPSASGADAGSYDVVVTNPCGSVTSAAALLSVNLPPSVAAAPSNVSVDLGVPFRLSVTASGTGPFTYQWSKGGQAISGGTASTLSVTAARSADSGTYSVSITNAYGSATASAMVTVSSIQGVLVLQQPTLNVELIKGSAVNTRLSIEPGDGSAIQTTFQLLASGSTPAAPVVQGLVNTNGIVDVPLRSLTNSGTYKVRFTRQYPGGASATTDSTPFNVLLHTWDEAAGAYETLLQTTESSDTAMGDNALYRGLLTLNVSKSGTFSGRLLYNEALPINNAAKRYYVPVTRALSGSFSPVVGEPLKMTASPRLGSASQAVREEITLELDFAASPPALKVSVSDRVSLAKAGLTCVSEAFNCTRIPSTASDLAKQLSGRYTLVADSDAPATGYEHNSYVLVQVLPSMRALWTTRLAGYSGSGSASLHTGNTARPSTQFYESRYALTNTLLSSASLLGLLSFEQGNDLVWRPTFKSDLLANGFEKQASYLSASAREPVYNPATDADRTGSKIVEFTEGRRSRWSGATSTALPAFVPAATTFSLTVSDPIQISTSYAWNVTVSASGLVRISAPLGTTPPVLSLRLDRTRGEWTGSYTINKVRRTLIGAAVDPGTATGVIGRGWIETGTVPTLSTSLWHLDR